ncbi:MAG: very short patch repair endonuclease [Mycobacteriales bacterium]|nr:very short patch repair endonuclease [Mycobacteriales bacterium]
MTRAPEVTSRIMSSVRNADTGPERALRSALHRRGLRYRVHRRMLGKPDITFVGPRVVVFVDGDYWHGNAWRTRGYADFDSYYCRGENGAFWAAKIRRNVERDQHVTEGLRADGWCVVRVWETDLASDLNAVADRIKTIVRDRAA